MSAHETARARGPEAAVRGAPRRGRRIPSAFGAAGAALSLALALAAGAAPAAAQEAPAAARAAVERLRAGAAFDGDARPFLGADGRLVAGALALLVGALGAARDDARAEVARALVAAGRAADPLAREGGDALRDPEVVAALVDPGLAHADDAKEVCLDALLESVPPALLAPHGPALVASFAASPDPTVALALAKAKPEGGLAALEAAVRADPDLGEAREVGLARAALGDAAAERALLDGFARAHEACAGGAGDADALRALVRDLGRVATPACLRALGLAVRSPVVVDAAVGRRALRLDVLAALRRTFPAEPALFGQRIVDDAGYEAAERFVERALGVTFTAPRPPFLTEHGRPR